MMLTILEHYFLYLKHYGVNTKFYFFCQKSLFCIFILDIFILSFFFEQHQKFSRIYSKISINKKHRLPIKMQYEDNLRNK